MKYRKRTIALFTALIMIACLAGCGSSKSSDSAYSRADYEYGAYNAAIEESAPLAAEARDYDTAYAGKTAASGAAGIGSANTHVSSAADMSEKIIYNADVTLETTSFDEALERISAMVADLGGYLESSSVSGSNYSSISKGYAGARSAHFSIRIPAARFSDLIGTISDLGNVPYSNTYTRNVTTQYYDTQSRLDAYRVQEKRLLEMLAIAESVEDMLAIQRELTDVQYEIDSLTGTLRYYDNQVGYSTVNLSVNEVKEYTPEPTVRLTYWERMSKGFKESVHKTAEFFKELFLWFVTSLPWLVPLCAAAALLIALIRRRALKNPERAERRRARREARKAAKEARRAARLAKKNGASSEDSPKE